MKRIVAVSDLHSGHVVGLTHPDYIPTHPAAKEINAVLSQMWEFYAQTIESLQPIDIAIVDGDLIDGQSKRSGGVEQLYSDLDTQCEMAYRAVDFIGADDVVICAGTPYHVNGEDGTDYEKRIADDLGGRFGGHEWVRVNGVTFDVKHKIGSSTIPHGRHTAIAKERLWNRLWAEVDGAPRADIFIRAHVHYFSYCGGPDWLAMTLPALQGPGSRYGVRQCSGIVDFGLVHFDIEDDGSYTWHVHTMAVRAALPRVVEL